MAWPMPAAAPVTSARRPSSSGTRVGRPFQERLTAFPAFLEEVEVNVLGRVRGGRVPVDGYAEAGLVRKGEAAVSGINLRQSGDDLVDPRIREVVEVLLDLEVRRARGEVQVRGCQDGSADVVGCDEHEVGLRRS